MMRVIDAYQMLIDGGELRPDADQAAAATRLDQLQQELEAPVKTGGGFLGKLFGKGESEAPRGIYMWGAVGRGKSMLMDLFYDQLAITEKRRVHFHAFMLEVHARLNEARKSESGDPILPVAAALTARGRIVAGRYIWRPCHLSRLRQYRDAGASWRCRTPRLHKQRPARRTRP